ncbi:MULTISPECIES: hypothetical protein [Neisseria]|uniref:hypothetical protein n=1 Tax=Neisseria TaxID=482 RepID=UPI0027E20F80|nr:MULTISPECIES: hypothetical protein [Neisseria]
MPSETVSDGIFKTPRSLPALRGTQISLIKPQTTALYSGLTKIRTRRRSLRQYK